MLNTKIMNSESEYKIKKTIIIVVGSAIIIYLLYWLVDVFVALWEIFVGLFGVFIWLFFFFLRIFMFALNS